MSNKKHESPLLMIPSIEIGVYNKISVNKIIIMITIAVIIFPRSNTSE